MTADQLAAIRARHERATPGPTYHVPLWHDMADLLAEVDRLRRALGAIADLPTIDQRGTITVDDARYLAREALKGGASE